MANQYGSNHRGNKQNAGAGQSGRNDQSVNQSGGKQTQPAASGRQSQQNQGSDTSSRNQGRRHQAHAAAPASSMRRPAGKVTRTTSKSSAGGADDRR